MAIRRRDVLFLLITLCMIPLLYVMASRLNLERSNRLEMGLAAQLEDKGATLITENILADDNPWPLSINDLSYSVAICIALCAARLLAVRPFEYLGRFWLSERKRKDPVRLYRFSGVLFKLIYFSVITGTVVTMFPTLNYFPPNLGGSGETRRAYDHMQGPMGTFAQQQSMLVRWYYLVGLGYHLHSLVYMVALEPTRKLDYNEMLLHHTATIALMVFSYLANYIRIGSLVLFVHDVSDLFTYLIKASIDTPYTALTLTMYTALLASWGYLRLYVFPFTVIRSAWAETAGVIPKEHTYLRHGLTGLLLCLQALHVYWYILFILMGLSFLKTGKTEDTQDSKKEAAEVVERKKKI